MRYKRRKITVNGCKDCTFGVLSGQLFLSVGLLGKLNVSKLFGSKFLFYCFGEDGLSSPEEEEEEQEEELMDEMINSMGIVD